MSAVNVYADEEEVFALSFANHVISDDDSTRNNITSSNTSSHNLTVGGPPPLLSDSPFGLSEPDEELSYQEELLSSPLLYKSERLISHTAKDYTYAGNNDDIIFTLDNEEENSEDLVIVPQQTARIANVSTYDDDFANAAQQNYRLWLSSF